MKEIPWQSIVPSGGRVFIGGGAMVPFHLIGELLALKDSFQDVELLHIHTLGPLPWVDEQYHGHFRPNSFFLSREMGEAVEAGWADYTPCPTSDVPRLFHSKAIGLDVALIQVSPPDADGYVSLGLSADVICAAVQSAKHVVAQINPRVPRTYGDTKIPLKAIDFSIEMEAEMPVMEEWEYEEHHRKIGEYAAQLIEDGATIQASMGNSPQAVLRALKGHKNLGIHTGVFTDSMMELMRCGAVNNAAKAFERGRSVASHCLGSEELYAFVRENKEIELRASEWVNNPHQIGQYRQVVAINGAREIDLTGQVVRDSRGHRFYGGIGATQDFIRGAAMSPGGRPIIALASRDSDGSSRIVTGLTAGSGVCSSRGDVHYVVTEYGIANLVGQSIRQRVLRLVEIAHPDVRESLLKGAREQSWIPASYGFNPRGLNDSDAGISSKRVEFDSTQYVMRSLLPSDLRSLQEFFYSQSEETIRLRYGYAMPSLDDSSAYRMASVDQSRDLAIGVFYRHHHKEMLRGVGRFYLEPDSETAEVAFLVHENARRKGIGNALLSEIAVIAKQRGVKYFWATVLKKNEPMVKLFMSRGAKRKKLFGEDSDEFTMVVDDLVAQYEAWLAKKASARKTTRKRKAKVQRKLAVWSSEELLKHHTGAGHPESVQRYQVLLEMLQRDFPDVKRLEDRVATVEEVTAAHSAHYHDMVRYDVENFAESLRTGDTAVCEDSYDVAMLASGAALAGVDAIMEKSADHVFCALRPPGHHASEDIGMGFCIFNHAAVAARYAQQHRGLKRVAILDWDVHHGNGTQDIFYSDPSVFYFSTHQDNLFPHTGKADEIGSGDGRGTTLNIPLASAVGDYEVLQAWGKPLEKQLKSFKPDLLIISAGFDAVKQDPLADLQMTTDGFAKLTALVCSYAEKFCDGRVLSLLEGGYEPDLLADCVRAHLQEFGT